MARLVTDALRHKSATGELRAALEEASVLAEELQVANEELHSANEALDQRVAERTAELGQANAELELVNADLHRRVEVETAARVKAQAELFQMQKLEAIGQLTGGIAHDFNNLLMVIINGLQVLAQSGDVRLRERALRRTQEASWRASELTRRLLAFARRQALHPERVDLPEHVEGLRELLGQGVRENIQLNIDIALDVWPLEADFGALELALLNLAVNARDAMPDGGKLTIAARNSTIAGCSCSGATCGGGQAITSRSPSRIPALEWRRKLWKRSSSHFSRPRAPAEAPASVLLRFTGLPSSRKAQPGWKAGSAKGPRYGCCCLGRDARSGGNRRDWIWSRMLSRASDLRVLVVEDETAVADAVLDMLMELGHRGRCVATMASALALLADSETD